MSSLRRAWRFAIGPDAAAEAVGGDKLVRVGGVVEALLDTDTDNICGVLVAA